MISARYLLRLCLLLLAGSISAKLVAATQVTVQLNDQTYQFGQLPRLAEVLQPVALQQDWYWPASALFRDDSERPELLRQQLLQRLTVLKGKWQQDSAYVDTIEQLRFQIKHWQLAERIVLNIDYDVARLNAAFTPQFAIGSYRLYLTARPQHITVFGLAKAERISHYGNASAEVFAKQVRRFAGASEDWIFIVQPDGKVIKAGVANWNQQHVELMPGAQLFVPFDSSLFGGEFAAINQLLVELAIHRVVR
ncbi:hypothetical protein WG68_03180 [Arsukibacterium ikkense]|uniref:Uncharacterized protein n=1 Tax=Arsukibacterium ikkense TaxID=336831 RepID=A0A0M2V7X2_9GAMM|nr:capsule biosynthesis GfcC family protein [Arsukibacterium ikkense]KKO46952.1 hypothetical protein WG68_03180 [Arsukibacterium ikkense]